MYYYICLVKKINHPNDPDQFGPTCYEWEEFEGSWRPKYKITWNTWVEYYNFDNVRLNIDVALVKSEQPLPEGSYVREITESQVARWKDRI